ncbi:hypothetical protein OE88DRAFT_825328 [Heliocybe sulcata]|uniref:Fungal-type protein kinase domain-containing protein n=1 Tax=Heliocybe sulcata TaxID=5364 RepID=A0A5C3MQY0_9AGAM|nr:hypothetical protein OE88DRAFT_825328 [Heliocybe sulcata]
MPHTSIRTSVFGYLIKTEVAKLTPNNWKKGLNTRSDAFSAKDIRHVEHWDLALKDITTAPFAHCLEREIESEHTTDSKPYVNDEATTAQRLEMVFWPHIRRTLRAGCDPEVPEGHVRIYCDIGSAAKSHPQAKPDRAARVSEDVPLPYRDNRLPGELKVSWKWSSDMVEVAPDDEGEEYEYRQVLSQLLFYMKVHQCRWGYIITDREVVCARRQPLQDNVIELSDAIPLTRCQDPLQNWSLGPKVDNGYPHAEGELTALLAICTCTCWHPWRIRQRDGSWLGNGGPRLSLVYLWNSLRRMRTTTGM